MGVRSNGCWYPRYPIPTPQTSPTHRACRPSYSNSDAELTIYHIHAKEALPGVQLRRTVKVLALGQYLGKVEVSFQHAYVHTR